MTLPHDSPVTPGFRSPTAPPTGASHGLPEQVFFSDPAIDRLLGMTMALAAEVYVLHSRLQRLERAQRRLGIDPLAAEPSAEEAEADRRDAQAFVAHLLQPALGEQQSRSPP